ncbi:MAG: GNAT family N-acetyltransferase [Clostridia bacterium]|nr:GNAT family N-acetyltransferase [Clostridia bacterium]
MYKLRKGRSGDNEQILKVANTAFSTVREQGFDFSAIMPKVYGAGKEFWKIHHVIECGGKIVSLAGNLPCEINVNGKAYKFSIVGTVSTLPECRGKGYMSALMNDIVRDSMNKQYVFSTLTGLRNRYRHFGFDKYTTVYKFVFEQQTVGYLKNNADLCVSVYDGNKDVLSALYAIYAGTNPFVKRTKERFVDCLRISDAEILVFTLGGQICGYASFTARKRCVQEIVLKDYSLLPEVVGEIMSRRDFSEITFLVNPLNLSAVKAFDAIAESKVLCDELHIRIFDMVKFLEMLLGLNGALLGNVNCEEVYVVDGQAISLKVHGGKAEVKECRTGANKTYTQSQFLRMVLGNGDNELCRNSNIFPLSFGINEPDMF